MTMERARKGRLSACAMGWLAGIVLSLGPLMACDDSGTGEQPSPGVVLDGATATERGWAELDRLMDPLDPEGAAAGERARKLFREVLERDRFNTDAHLGLATYYERTGSLDLARRHLEGATHPEGIRGRQDAYAHLATSLA